MTKVAPQRISREELVNSLTHGLGFALSVVGFAVLLILAILHGSALRIVSCSVYGFALVLLYTASTLYHSVRPGAMKNALQVRFRDVSECSIPIVVKKKIR